MTKFDFRSIPATDKKFSDTVAAFDAAPFTAVRARAPAPARPGPRPLFRASEPGGAVATARRAQGGTLGLGGALGALLPRGSRRGWRAATR